MKHRTFFWLICPVWAALWMSAAMAPGESAGSGSDGKSDVKDSPQTNYTERILAAARAGNGVEIEKIIAESFKSAGKIGEGGATDMLDSLLESRETEAFRVLLEQLRQTNLGKNWQPNEKLLAGLVKDGRRDLLDVLLASRLELPSLEAQKKSGDAAMAAWIGRRVAETARGRAEIDELVDACKRGDTDRVLELLDAGVDINSRVNDGGFTPLSQAARVNQVGVVSLLLERGAQVDLPKYPGWDYTPLCLTSSVEVANILKNAGANIHANLFRRNTSILTYVAMFGGAPMVQWFIDQGLDPKMTGDNGQTLLFNVKDEATAEILLKAGVDPNRLDEFGRSPLQEARSAGVVRALIRGGAKLDGMKSPLLLGMIQMSEGEAVEAVLQAGAPHDAETMHKAMIAAAHMDNDKTTEVLLRYGAKPDEPGEWSGPDNKMLPLEVCCIFGSVKTAKVLLTHGANPNAGDKPGMMLRTAISNRYKELAKLLKEAGAKGVSDLAYAIAVDDAGKKTELLAAAPSYAEQPEFWDEVLSAAAKRGDVATVKAALEKGVPVFAGSLSEDGYASAAWEGQWEVLDFLLGKRSEKADPEELRQALWVAVWNSHPYPEQRPTADFEKCVRMLLDAGAPVARRKVVEGEKKDYDMVTSAVFTRYPGGNRRVIEMLVLAGADPDPEYAEGKHLSEVISQSCKEKTCSTPEQVVVDTLEKLRRLKGLIMKISTKAGSE